MLLILTGPPGAGKTTVGAIIASESPLSACIHSDWFWTTIVNGNAGFTTVLDGNGKSAHWYPANAPRVAPTRRVKAPHLVRRGSCGCSERK